MGQQLEPGTRDAILAEVGERHPSTVHVLRYFAWAHLPEYLQAVSMPVAELAVRLVQRLDDGPELTVALRKLLEAKDAFVRQRLEGSRGEPS